MNARPALYIAIVAPAMIYSCVSSAGGASFAAHQVLHVKPIPSALWDMGRQDFRRRKFVLHNFEGAKRAWFLSKWLTSGMSIQNAP